jgi:hypothetical protein
LKELEELLSLEDPDIAYAYALIDLKQLQNSN